MKKKVVALVLAAAMTFGLTACGGGGDSAGTDNASGAAAESADAVKRAVKLRRQEILILTSCSIW